ncbi:MAG: hypothetical protein HY879_00680 [Deltaproteobacteria bacterium]|nr:hypothetical protein [Deltaproteobacteria bacterium]
MREMLAINADRLGEVNRLLTDPENETINPLLEIVERYGGPETINAQAEEARKPENLKARLKEMGSPYLADLDWLAEKRESGAFVSLVDYYRSLGIEENRINTKNAVTLEISALQYFPWLIDEARQAIEKKELLPGRFIRVRNMKEQEGDQGDTLATALAMSLIGATYVETLDTKGTDGSNIHLGGPETITGYFGGVGQPNDYPYKWVDEFLYFYTRYGVRQVLNINPGTVLAGYLLYKMGIDIEFKISVFMGNDNPFAVLWTLMAARLFSRPDGSTSLIGFNLSNSVNNQTIIQADHLRKALGLEDKVRFEHHITETWKSIVRQPYNRRDELVALAGMVPNISAKHEGGEIAVEENREHPSDILDYFLPKTDIEARGLMPLMLRNYLDKHDSVNLTAQALVKANIGVIAASNLHR